MFQTHDKREVTGQEFENACQKVGDWLENLAHDIYNGDSWAAHVTQETKDIMLAKRLEHVARVKSGDITTFADWQRINTELTGECIAFLPK